MIQIMLWDLQADGNFKYLILGLYCRWCWLILSSGIIAGCPSRRNDEWLCEKNTVIPYMAVYLYDDAPSRP
jgi:hypothetical protein